MKGSRQRFAIGIIIAVFLGLLVAIFQVPNLTVWAQGNENITSLTESLSSTETKIEQSILNNAKLLGTLDGARAEVMAIAPTGVHFPAELTACESSACYEVKIYNYDANSTLTAIVDSADNKVLEVYELAGSQPSYNLRIQNRAIEIMQTDPQVTDALGFVPDVSEIDLMHVIRADSTCAGSHYCLGETFVTDSGNVTVVLDMTTETVSDVWWDQRHYAYDSMARTATVREITAAEAEACDDVFNINQNGWTMDAQTTETDGLLVANVSFNGTEVASSIKLVEWHAIYPSNFSYVDRTGCRGFGPQPGFPILPLGMLEANAITDGFEVTQLFSMSQWPFPCNYRYRVTYSFYNDGSFRAAMSAFGPGCGFGGTESEALYIPVMRIDLDIDGSDDDTFAYWNQTSNEWTNAPIEGWLEQTGTTSYSPDGYLYRITDSGGAGYYIEPGQGQFGDGGLGDNAYTYVTKYAAAEGAADLPSLVNDDQIPYTHEQGPDQFINNEAITDENIVIWYASQSQTVTSDTPGSEYCWSDGEQAQWPCWTGPLFVPISSAPPTAVELVSADSDTLSTITVISAAGALLLIGTFALTGIKRRK